MSKKHISKAHDHFFRKMMSDKEVAYTFFEAHLPKEVLAVIDLTALELQSSSYIDDMRKESIADLLFKTVVGGHTAYLYLLVDHQSRPDELMPFRLLKYLCNVIDQNLKETGSKRIPLILPIVVYHGRQPWNYSNAINDLVDAPRELVEEYFLKPFTLLDLNKINDAEIKRNTWAAVMELTMKHIFARDMQPYLKEIILLIKYLEQSDGKILAETVLTYILDRGELGNKNTFFDLVKTNLGSDVGEKIMTIAEQLKAEGMQQAMEQVAERLLAENEDPARVATLTSLPLEKIKELKRNLH
jgi:predicted transposase/invertase (TIGR01784 family)